MSSVSEAKKALQFNQEFVHLVGVLKGVAASQFQALTQARQRFEVFTHSFDGFFKLIDLADTKSPFVSSQSETIGVVIVTSDEGFMGGLNTKVINAALAAAGSGPKELMVIGTRGVDALKDLKLAGAPFPGLIHEARHEQASQLKDFIVDRVVQKKIGRVILAYPYPVSLMVQRPEIVRLLPCDELFQKKGDLLSDKRGVIVESSIETIIKQLVGTWITYRLCEIFEESKIAELAARTMHLEESHGRLTDEGKILRYRYFRARRELIDKGMRETFASILLRRSLQDG